VAAHLETNTSSRAIRLPALALVGLSLSLASGCGGSDDGVPASESAGRYPAEIVSQSFPAKQRLSQTNDLELAVRNTGRKAIPNLTVTINTVPADAEGEVGVADGAFSIRSTQQGVSIPTRPVWVLEAGWPRLDGSSKPAGAEQAQTNTYAFGELQPGQTATMAWRLTSVRSGPYDVSWKVEAGVGGAARAVAPEGGTPEGETTVLIDPRPLRQRVTPDGRVVPVR